MSNKLQSFLSPYIKDYLTSRNSGKDFERDEHWKILKAFDRYIAQNEYNGPDLSEDLVMSYYKSKLEKDFTRSYLQKIGGALRGLAFYMTVSGSDAYYIRDLLLPPKKSIAYFIPSREKIIELLNYLDQEAYTKPRHGIGHLYSYTVTSMVLRITYLGGTRPGEACRLMISDVDKTQERIYIRESKANKSRYAYLPKEMFELLDQFREQFSEITAQSPYVFPMQSKPDKKFSEGSVGAIFKKAWQTLHGDNDNFRPTPHSLRHAYCVHTIDRWSCEKQNIQALLPYLSSQLGHATMDDTLYYYHQVNASGQAIRKFLEADNSVSARFLDAYKTP